MVSKVALSSLSGNDELDEASSILSAVDDVGGTGVSSVDFVEKEEEELSAAVSEKTKTLSLVVVATVAAAWY